MNLSIASSSAFSSGTCGPSVGSVAAQSEVSPPGTLSTAKNAAITPWEKRAYMLAPNIEEDSNLTGHMASVAIAEVWLALHPEWSPNTIADLDRSAVGNS